MKRFLLAVALLSVGTMAFAQSWEPLFNGKNLKGWTRLNGKATYKVQDGAIVGTTKCNTANTFLVTNKKYGDFILEFEFKVDEAINSGVQFRSASTKDYKNGRVHGYQYEIDPSARAWSAGIYDEGGRGWLYKMVGNPDGQQAFIHNDWNKARVEACGNSIKTWLNGEPCANIWDDAAASGFIALQVHSIGDNKAMAGKQVAWRNIRICTTNVSQYLTSDGPQAPEKNIIDNTLSPKEQKEGWKLLWDGKTTNGWRGAKIPNFPEKGWSIEDGILKVHSSDGAESANGGDIVTDRFYRNFVLCVDFKITKGANSGIKYFVQPGTNKGEGSDIGCEFQILDDDVHPDAKLGVNGNRKLASLYDLIPAPVDKYVDKSAFNTAMVVVRGNHVEHWLNGCLILTYERNNQMWNALVAYSKYKNWTNFGNFEEGAILLQDHGDEVWFKNIKILELQ